MPKRRSILLLIATALLAAPTIAFVRKPLTTLRRARAAYLALRGAKERWRTTRNGIVRSLHMGDEGLPPLLLLHGLNDSAETWAEVMPHLARHFHVVAPDLPGFGRSPVPHGGMNVWVQAEAIKEILGEMGRQPVTVMGNSLGGGIGIYLALEAPKQVRHLILLDAAGVQFELEHTIVPTTREQTRTLLKAIGGDALGQLPNFMLDALTRELGSKTAQELLDSVGELEAFEQRLSQISVPTTVVWGSNDLIIPLSVGQRLHSLIPNAAWMLLEGAGHSPQVTRPKQVVELVLQGPQEGKSGTWRNSQELIEYESEFLKLIADIG